MAQTKQLKKSQGFTLMEMLIVVAIVVILIAVSIPVFAGQIQKAKVSTDLANIRSAKAAAFAEYLTTEPSEDTFYCYDAANGNIVIGTNTAQTIEGYGKSSKEVTGASGIPNVNGVARYLVVKIAVGGIMTASWGGTLGDAFVRDAVVKAFLALKDKKGNPININIDSTTPTDNGPYLKTMLNTLAENGLDMNALSAVSWKVFKNNDGDVYLWFTQKDITEYEVGDKVPIIQYNDKSKNYTVWTSKVISQTNEYGTYNVLNGQEKYENSTKTTANGNQSYTKSLDYYSELDKKLQNN